MTTSFQDTDNQAGTTLLLKRDSNRLTARKRRRAKKRELFCPAHPHQRLAGNGKKYFLHLLTPEQLQQRGISSKQSKLLIHAYPVFVLSTEWLEELFCPECGCNKWCHVIKHDRINHTVSWAAQDLWQQVAHVDPMVTNPTVSEFSRREARRYRQKRGDGKSYYG